MDMVEKVGKALYDAHWSARNSGPSRCHWERLGPGKMPWLQEARAAIAAMREPNEPMLATFHDVVEIMVYPDEKAASIMNDRKVWAAMIDAALTSEGK